LVLHTAWKIDSVQDYQAVRKDIAAIKVLTPRVVERVARRAIQVHGALGVTSELPLMRMLTAGIQLALADGPTEVHQVTVARQVLRDYRPVAGAWPSAHLPTATAVARAGLTIDSDPVTTSTTEHS
jgi:acyl-CoA dehydrogenase